MTFSAAEREPSGIDVGIVLSFVLSRCRRSDTSSGILISDSTFSSFLVSREVVKIDAVVGDSCVKAEL